MTNLLSSWLQNSKQVKVVVINFYCCSLVEQWGGGWAERWSGLEEGFGAGRVVQVLPDGVVMHGGSQSHKHVPDGVSKGDDAVALEEEYAEAVDESSTRQLLQAVRVALEKQKQRKMYS